MAIGREPEPSEGTQTANNLIQSQLDKPVQERDRSAFENASDAIVAANTLNHQVQQQAAAAGIEPNSLKAEAIVDDQGRFVGMRVSNG